MESATSETFRGSARSGKSYVEKARKTQAEADLFSRKVAKKVFTDLTEKQSETVGRDLCEHSNRSCFFLPDDYEKYGDFSSEAVKSKKNTILYTPQQHTTQRASLLKAVTSSNSHHGLEHHDHIVHEHDHHGSHGEHHLAEPAIGTALAAGLINYTLMFGFCSAYGLIMFQDPGNHRHSALGMRMAMGCAMMMGLFLTTFSKIPIAIGGPDMNAVIFVGTFVDTISKELVRQLQLVDPVDANYADATVGKYFCVDEHYAMNTWACDEYHTQLRATVLFSVTLSSATVAVVFGLLGLLRVTVYVSYVPTSIVDAFLSCMGYKVFKYGIKLCKYDPAKFIPAAFVGVPAYFIKAMHIGNPLITLPTFLLLPVIFAYLQILISGDTPDEARKHHILFTKTDAEPFWTIWTDGVYNTDKINYTAWWETKWELVTMIVVLVLDCLVTALRTTETKMPVKVMKNYESTIYGFGNMLSAVCGGVPGYMQLKFNMINFGIMANTTDRRSGVVFVILCGVTFFTSGFGFNYVPRVFIGALMFFGGSGFVAEHLWGSKDYLSYAEWGQVLMILCIFVLTDEIVYAVVIGCMLCGLTFITKYANVPCIAGVPLRGGDMHSHEQYAPMVLSSLTHISKHWLLIIRLKGFVFFASVQSVTRYIRDIIMSETNLSTPKYRRVKFVLLDCQLLDGLDSSAEKDLQLITRDASSHGIRIIWSSLDSETAEGMQKRGTIKTDHNIFKDMDDALLYIEGCCLGYRKKQQELWDQLHPAFALHKELSNLRESFEPWANVLRLDSERFGIPWDFVGTIKIRQFKTMLWSPNQTDRELFLVHTGAVGIFRHIPDHKGQGDVSKPLAVYRHGWFLNREFLTRAPTRHYAVALEDGEIVYWSKHEWWRMHREMPFMANAILEAAMRQASCDMERVSAELSSVGSNSKSEAELLEAPQSQIKASMKSLTAVPKIGRPPKVIHHPEVLLPADLEKKLEGLMNAQCMEKFRLYDTVPSGEIGFLPVMPPSIQRDLDAAFSVYKLGRPGMEVIPWNKVKEALMYAGLFGTLLKASGHDLTEEEFIEVGHEAIFHRLNNVQIAKLYNVFKEFANKFDGLQIPRDELHECLQSSFLPVLSEQELNGVAEIWDVDSDGNVDAGEFVGIVSRLLRRHEVDWNLLRGCRDLLRKPAKMNVGPTDVLNVQKLLKKSVSSAECWNSKVTESLATEMLWSNACYGKLLSLKQQGQILDFTGLVGAVVFSAPKAVGKLPPLPRHDGQASSRKLSRFLNMRSSCASSLRTTQSSYQPARLSLWPGEAPVRKTLTFGDFPDLTSPPISEPGSPGAFRQSTKARVSFAAELVDEATPEPKSKPKKKMKAKKKVKAPDADEASCGADVPLTHLGSLISEPTAMMSSVSFRSSSASMDSAPEQSVSVGPMAGASLSFWPARTDDDMEGEPEEIDPAWDRTALHPSRAALKEALRKKFPGVRAALLRLGALAALEEIGDGVAETSNKAIAGLVADLRIYPSATTAVPRMFFESKLEALDFSQEYASDTKKGEGPMELEVDEPPDVKIHRLLEDPASSSQAVIFSYAMGVVILLSVLCMFVKSLANPYDAPMYGDEKVYWRVPEACFTIIFLAELMVRFSVCNALQTQTHLEFLLKPLNICDILACLPFIMELASDGKGDANASSDNLSSLRIARLLRLSRVLRIVRLGGKDGKFSQISGPVAIIMTIIWGIYLKDRPA